MLGWFTHHRRKKAEKKAQQNALKWIFSPLVPLLHKDLPKLLGIGPVSYSNSILGLVKAWPDRKNSAVWKIIIHSTSKILIAWWDNSLAAELQEVCEIKTLDPQSIKRVEHIIQELNKFYCCLYETWNPMITVALGEPNFKDALDEFLKAWNESFGQLDEAMAKMQKYHWNLHWQNCSKWTRFPKINQ